MTVCWKSMEPDGGVYIDEIGVPAVTEENKHQGISGSTSNKTDYDCGHIRPVFQLMLALVGCNGYDYKNGSASKDLRLMRATYAMGGASVSFPTYADVHEYYRNMPEQVMNMFKASGVYIEGRPITDDDIAYARDKGILLDEFVITPLMAGSTDYQTITERYKAAESELNRKYGRTAA